MAKQSSFLKKLTAIMLLLSIVPIIVFGINEYFEEVNDSKDKLKNKLMSNAQINADNIKEWLDIQKQEILSIANNKSIISSTKLLSESESSEIDKFVTRITLEEEANTALTAFVDMKKILITDAHTNNVIFYTSQNIPQTDFLEEIMKNLEKDQVYVHDIFQAQYAKQNEFGNFEKNLPVLWITTPIYGEAELIANISTEIDWLNFQNIIDMLEFSSTDTYIVDEYGTVLTRPGFVDELKAIGVDSRPEGNFKLVQPHTTEFTQIFKEKSSDGLIINLDGYTNYIGNNVIGAIIPIQNTNWYYVVEVDSKEASIGIISTQILLISIISIIVLIVTGLAIYFSTRLFDPIQKLINGTQKVSRGDLSVKIENKGNDELAALTESFNIMVRNLDQSIRYQRLAEERFQILYNDAPTLNRTIDINGKILDCNEAYAKRLGYSKEEIIGQSIFDHCDPDEIQKLETTFKLWKETGKVNNREISLKSKDGTTFPALLSASSIYDENGTLLTSNSVIIDISKRKEAERRMRLAEKRVGQERLLAIGELGARLAHDLRNPLSVIRNTLYLFNRDIVSTDKKTRNYITMMNKAVSRINHQINNVLDFVRDVKPEYRLARIDEVLQNALELTEVHTDIKISLETSDVEVECDPNQIEIVFSNIMRNAVEAIGEDKGVITVKIDEAPDNVVIKFIDSGPGIPEKDMQSIFDPLFTTKFTGTGLGLASCKNIVALHGGQINVSNNPTTVSVVLPKTRHIEK